MALPLFMRQISQESGKLTLDLRAFLLPNELLDEKLRFRS
jgi:hypothetical protein